MKTNQRSRWFATSETAIPAELNFLRQVHTFPALIPRIHIIQDPEVRFTDETEKKLKDLAARSGRGTDELVESVMVADD